MSSDLIIGTLGLLVAIALGALGFNVSVYPITPGDVRRIKLYKWLFGCFTIAAAGLAVTQAIRNDHEKQQSAKDVKDANNKLGRMASDMAVLQAETKSAKDAQQANTRIFTDSFSTLSKELEEIRTQVKTEELRRRITTLQSELENTQKALVPPPKAALVLSFQGFKNPLNRQGPLEPIRAMTLPATADGHITVPISIVNGTEADAVDGHVTLIICRLCKYAKEPESFKHVLGTPEQHRWGGLKQLLAETAIHMQLEVVVERSVTSFTIDIQYRCRTCVLENNSPAITVRVKWPDPTKP